MWLSPKLGGFSDVIPMSTGVKATRGEKRRERAKRGVRGRAGGREEVSGNSVEGGFPYFRVQATPGVWRDDPDFWGLGGGGGRGQDTKGEPRNFRKSREDPDLGGL